MQKTIICGSAAAVRLHVECAIFAQEVLIIGLLKNSPNGQQIITTVGHILNVYIQLHGTMAWHGAARLSPV
jgi:hypothetical protein